MKILVVAKHFQSTLLQEERQLDCALKISIFNLSIHAPTRGATINFIISHHVLILSIHAPTRGATWKFTRILCKTKSFNPRSYKRSDKDTLLTVYTQGAFNPRSYKRSDDGLVFIQGMTHLSIHAPTRGATPHAHPPANPNLLSIHAPTRGATNLSNKMSICMSLSIHAPTRGATICVCCSVCR